MNLNQFIYYVFSYSNGFIKMACKYKMLRNSRKMLRKSRNTSETRLYSCFNDPSHLKVVKKAF